MRLVSSFESYEACLFIRVSSLRQEVTDYFTQSSTIYNHSLLDMIRAFNTGAGCMFSAVKEYVNLIRKFGEREQANLVVRLA